MKVGHYKGKLYEVVSEENGFVTLEALDKTRKTVQIEEVILSEVEEEALSSEIPEKPLIDQLPDDGLKDSPAPDEAFFEQEGQITPKAAQLQQQIALNNEKIAKIDQQNARLNSQLAKEQESSLNEDETTMPEKEWDKYSEQGVDVNPEMPSDRKKENDERMKLALQGLREKFKTILNEIEGVMDPEEDENGYLENILSVDVVVDSHADIEKINALAYSLGGSADSTNDKEFLSFSFPKSDPTGEYETSYETFKHDVSKIPGVKSAKINAIEYKLEEEGVASVAGVGCADGTSSPTVNATQGIAQFPSRLGVGLQKRIEESLFVAPEFVLNEALAANINRHLIADMIEDKYEPLNESEGCSKSRRLHERRKAIGRYATLKECANFIAENVYSCHEQTYKPREVHLNRDDILNEMKSLASKALRKIRKA